MEKRVREYHMDGAGHRWSLVLSMAVFGMGVAGCGTDFGGGGTPVAQSDSAIDGNRDSTLISTLGKTSGEPNDTFADAVVAVFDELGTARLQGSISGRGDLDVYLLGGVSAGDRIVVDAVVNDSALDVTIAVFDAEQRLVVNNDDRTVRNLDSFVDWIARHGGSSYYLVVASSPFAASNGFSGTYQVDVERTEGFEIPQPVGQIVLLNFDGGTVDAPSLGPTTVRPFDAASISRIYRGQTSRLKELIRDSMVQNYLRFNVVVMTSDDPPPPPDVLFTTIFLGGFNPAAFGIAESVDLYNADFCDDAIIYAESFGPGAGFTSAPTVEGLAVAIGNVTAHEAGHLLGLNHVSDDLALMDDRSVTDAFLEDQEFTEAPLSSDIMPIGTQDARLLLLEIVGPAAPEAAKPAANRIAESWPMGTLPHRGGPIISRIQERNK